MDSKRSLQLFKSSDHYRTVEQPLYKKDEKTLPAIRLTSTGLEKIADYYRQKYAAKITFTKDLGIGRIHDLYDANLSESEKQKNIAALQAEIKKCAATNDRQAFILVKQDGRHAAFLAFIRENNQEGLLLIDSFYHMQENAKKLAATFNMPVYTVAHTFQEDHDSCYAYSVLFARDITAKTNGEYRITNLLTQLQQRKTLIGDNTYTVSLPDELLKTLQSNRVVYMYKENSTKTVHQHMADGKLINETLDDYRKRYAQKNVVTLTYSEDYKKGDLRNIADYIRQKGLKLANIIEIQFYITQLKKQLGLSWTNALQKEFIKQSKVILKSQTTADTKRAGLYLFAEEFLQECIKPSHPEVKPNENDAASLYKAELTFNKLGK